MKTFFKKYFFEIVIIIFFSLTPLLWLRGGEIILGHDANYHINHVERMISSTFSWNDKSYYGNDWTYDRGYLPINLVQLLLLKVTPSFSAMQSVFFVFIFLLLGFSVYALTVGVFPEEKYRPFRLISAVFAMFNFFILQGWFTGDTGRFLIFAGLPVYILVIHNLFTGVWSPKKSFIIFAILSFFFNGNGLPPLVGFQGVIVCLVGLFYAIFYIKKYRWVGLWFSLKTAVSFMFIFVLVNAYWLLPIVNFTSASYSSSVATSGGVEGTLAWEQMISKYASFINLFRMQGIADWYDNAVHAYSHPYISDPFLIFVSFIPIITIIVGLCGNLIKRLQVQQRRLILLLLLVLVFGLFLSSGTHPPFGKVYELFMRYIPGFVIFRSSLYKFGFAFWIPMILLFGYFSGEFINKMIKKELGRYIAIGVIVIGIAGFHYPYFSPEKIFHFTDVFKTRFVLPKYVTDMFAYLDAEIPISSRILLLPELDSEYIGIPVDAYTWGFYSIVMLPNFVSDHTYIADNEGDNIIQMIYRSIYSGDVSTFEHLTRKTGISYILFRQDVQLAPGAQKQHPIAVVEKSLLSIPSIHLVKEFGDWHLYSISSSKNISMVSSLQSYDMILPPTMNSTYLMARDTDDSHGVVQVFSDDTQSILKESVVKQIIESECYLCKKDEYIQLMKGIVLPTKQTLPSFLIGIISARKERQNLSLTANTPKERIDVDLSLTQQELAGIITLMQKGGQPARLSRDRYKRFLQDIMDKFNILSRRDRNIYAIRIKAYFESQLLTVIQYKDLQEEAGLLNTNIQIVGKEAWYTSDIAHLRFGFTLTTSGTYEFYIPDKQLYANQILLDGSYVSSSDPAYLKEGFHTVEVNRVNMDMSIFNGPPALFIEQTLGGTKMSIPRLTYTRINPTHYIVHVSAATGPFILELNQQYDSRWKAYLMNFTPGKSNSFSGGSLYTPFDYTFLKTLLISPLPDNSHIEINGYANGWYISKTGDFDVVLTYWPQRIFYAGVIISGIAIVTILTIVGYSVIKKKVYEKK